jgi:hypothetical protein
MPAAEIDPIALIACQVRISAKVGLVRLGSGGRGPMDNNESC